MLKKILLLTLAVSIGVVSNLSGFIATPGVIEVSAEAPATPHNAASIVGNNELRGVWIATVFNIDFPSRSNLSAAEMRAEIDNIIKNAKEANLNAIFFQVRPTSDALYNSAIFPASRFLVGTQGAWVPDRFDPLEYIIEQAHANNIELHAWINPYRITTGSAANPQHNLNALSANNPARLNPSWTVAYADGRLYYNPGMPEVRDLVVRGVMEIVRKYKVDGIHFDDYFYPSPPAGGAKFNDDAAFAQHGAGQSLEDFRRSSVNKLVKEVYDAIKEENPSVRFGVSPSGIWANQSARSPAGSRTSGFESYHTIYADAKAWIEGGYIDYICPQIYWQFGHSRASYDILVRWWSALVDGTGVDLYIGHAAYRLSETGEVADAFKNNLELPRQVEYGRAYMGVAGSIFYGYKDIAANSYNIKDNLAKLFAAARPIPKPADTRAGITVGRPSASGATVTTAGVNIMAGSNPIHPVYYNNQKVTRTKSGFFSVFVPLETGRNNITFYMNKQAFTHVVNRSASRAAADIESEYTYPQMDSYKIEVIRPADEIITNPGDRITLRVQAPSKSTVTASLGGETVSLTPLTIPPDEGDYMTEVYAGTITLSDMRETLTDLGEIVYTARRGAEIASAAGANVQVVNTASQPPIEVIRDHTPFKIATDSNSYDDYMFQPVGMRDNVVAVRDGFYQLGSGGFIPVTHAVLTPERTLLTNRILSAAMEDMGGVTEIRFAVTENVPVDAKALNGVFTVTLFNTPEGARSIALTSNPMFRAARHTASRSRRTATYTFDLVHADNWYGFEVVYEKGFIVIRVKNPIRKPENDRRPFEGMTIVLDAGHGGNDPGALGFIPGKHEKDLNLDIALPLRTRLRALGANVVMTRTEDIALTPAERMEIFNRANPDLVISIHHNSLGDAQDNSLVRGYLGLYHNDAGRLFTKSMSRAISAELNRFERTPRQQAVHVLRNHKFPSTLLEMSFISNPDEYEFGVSSEGVWRSVEGIVSGIHAWIDDQQRWVR
jgi:uncharacterized lipoprotein YddW (UPF0748 family)/N-acetylmuramoyl-L-alanine amidase